jgi:outer membrane lipoprotein-sorting protein
MKYSLIALLMLISAFPSGSAQQSEYPMMEKVAQKVIEKYQKSSCEDLKAQKEQAPDPQQAAMKQKAVAALKNDPKMREQFLNKVAGPIANKLFECGMVP